MAASTVARTNTSAVVLPKTPQRHNPRIRQTVRVSLTFDEAQSVLKALAAVDGKALSRGDQARVAGFARLLACVVALGVRQ